MAVTTTYTPIAVNWTTTNQAIPITWPFFTGSLVVTEVSSTGVETVKTLTTHYTVSGGTDSDGLPATGTVTMVGAATSGSQIRVTRSTPATQSTEWLENDPFPAATVEAAFDRLTLIAQEQAASGSDDITGDVLQLNTAGATDFWDAENKIIRNVATPTASTDAANKSYVDTLTAADQVALAQAAAAAAQAAADSFDDVYLGSKAANPTLDNDGNALVEGQLYWNSVSNELRAYNGSAWVAYSPTSGVTTVNSRNAAVTLVSTDLTMTNTARVVGRKTAAGGASEEVTLSELLDFIGSAAQGDILYRGASSWERLAAGTSGQFLRTLGTGANPGWAAPTAGLHALWVPASAMVARTTAGAASGSAEMSTNRIMFRTFDFDTTTQEFVQFAARMPKRWNEGTLTAAFTWSHASTSTNFGVVWAIEAIAFSDDDAGDTAFGTAQQIADTGGTTNDVYITGITPAITVGGSPAEQDWVVFQIKRVPSDASDTMAIDARLHGVTLYLTTNASTDD